MKNGHLTLEQLEDDVWPAPSFHSGLVTRCHELRKKPLSDFTIADLQKMIGQNIGISFLLSIAIDKLRKNPLVEGDFYAGDLLVSILTRDSSVLRANPSFYKELISICHAALASKEPVLSGENRTLVQKFIGNT